MRPLINVCKLPKPNGRGGFKFPKLVEAYKHLFGADMEGAHGALGDARGCARIFQHMVRNNMLTEAQLVGVQEIR
jgi:DNA polymerase III epsilon subunit-like protein